MSTFELYVIVLLQPDVRRCVFYGPPFSLSLSLSLCMCVCMPQQAEIREAELKRLREERTELRERLCESRARNREMTSVMNDLQLCLNDLQSKVRGRHRTSECLCLLTFVVENYSIVLSVCMAVGLF